MTSEAVPGQSSYRAVTITQPDDSHNLSFEVHAYSSENYWGQMRFTFPPEVKRVRMYADISNATGGGVVFYYPDGTSENFGSIFGPGYWFHILREFDVANLNDFITLYHSVNNSQSALKVVVWEVII